MRMHVLQAGRLRMRAAVYLPEAPREATIDLPVLAYLLRHRQGNVLFDSGCHPLALADPQARWGAMTKVMQPVGDPRINLLSQLAALSIEPDDIDVVINSHFHTDHCGCNAFFERATFFCHARELAAADAPDAVRSGYLAIDWRHPMPLKTIDAQHDLFDDGRIVLVPLPGHTAGSIGARIELPRDGAFLLASDAVPLRAVLERELTPRNTIDPHAAAFSLREVERMQSAGVQIVFGHDPQQFETLRTGAAGYQ